MTNTAHLTELGHSPDALAQRQADLLALLRQTAPEVLSDNQINIEKLKELLGEERIAPAEHYELNWAGKTEARREIQKTSSHTLRPDANNPAHAQHMLIEGENLEVLRVLQKSYYGKVKMIYIDPPYNTGNDSFVYPDDYSETLDEYQKRTGEKSAEGYLNKQSLWKKNSKESGQYHSAWLSMMYPRLYLARNLLRDDGVIFISIDDNEAANLKVLCDEVFGEGNFLCQFAWRTDGNFDNQAKFKRCHEYILAYAKKEDSFPHPITVDPNTPSDSKIFRPEIRNTIVKNGPKNPTSEVTLPKGFPAAFRVGTIKPRQDAWPHILDEIVVVDGLLTRDARVFSGWSSKDLLEEFISNGCNTVDDSKGQATTFEIIESGAIEAVKVRGSPSHVISVLTGFGGPQKATASLQALEVPFTDYPKPVGLIRYLSRMVSGDDFISIDFFAGSGTTAESIMELNAIDDGNRQCISVQMPEVLDETSEAYKAGYRTIADITRARIDKVIAKLKAEHPDKTADLACAHFTLAPSNFKVWRGDVGSADALREQLALFQSAEKAGQPQATDAQTAMLTELLLKHGLGALGVHAVSAPKQVAGVTVHRVLMPDDKAMWLCFDTYTDALKDEIVKAQPAQVVMLNSCFVGDKADEQLSNLQLELGAPGRGIGLTVI
ncbi:site-specific DNA-methyltransferase [Acidovorax sp. IB03]|uniref:site-specific DNA-methyltransferase n=1 Tax=Acidovorax sp. IB03 TaxID=2779366 RepID=UPI0018E73004|nr:site-specific DNA-methyltransferase [Acidovorax sp. IB03]MBJ2164213.1 site-specific DNA-methyltransferase [Acidovorax sp. IB03]